MNYINHTRFLINGSNKVIQQKTNKNNYQFSRNNLEINHLENLYRFFQIIQLQYCMQCTSCALRFNRQARQPYILRCGHSICKRCLSGKNRKCLSCHEVYSDYKLNFSLLEIVEKQKNDIDKFIKICFIGSSAVGKTSLIRILTGKNFQHEIPSTIGYDFAFIDRKVDGYNVRYQLWDSAGQERFKAISPIHYKNADAIIIVYAMNEKPCDNRIPYWLEQAEAHAKQTTKKVLIGNKLDLVQGQVCKPFEPSIWQSIKQKKITHLQLSCKSKAGIQQFWRTLQQVFFQKKATRQPTKIQTKISMSKLLSSQKYGCCLNL